MPITESRLKTGTLTIDALSFASQATNVHVDPKTDEQGDSLEVLSGDTVQPEDVTTSSLVIEAVQDFDDAAGFVAFTWQNKGELVPFTWSPNDGSATVTGTCRVRPVQFGGDVNKRLTTTATFPIAGDPVMSWPV